MPRQTRLSACLRVSACSQAPGVPHRSMIRGTERRKIFIRIKSKRLWQDVYYVLGSFGGTAKGERKAYVNCVPYNPIILYQLISSKN